MNLTKECQNHRTLRKMMLLHELVTFIKISFCYLLADCYQIIQLYKVHSAYDFAIMNIVIIIQIFNFWKFANCKMRFFVPVNLFTCIYSYPVGLVWYSEGSN